jgi:hypothetical protein
MRAETASLAVESGATGTTVTLRFLAQPDQPPPHSLTQSRPR